MCSFYFALFFKVDLCAVIKLLMFYSLLYLHEIINKQFSNIKY
jgi:hypothetical protein